jgi:uncharacterized protein (DUF2147 family)
MRRSAPLLAAVATAGLLTLANPIAPVAQGRTLTAAGLWAKLDFSGKPKAWFRIIDRNGIYDGKIVKIFAVPGENPSNFRCTECEGGQKNASVIGLTFIKGMRRQGLSYRDGTILDPRDGSVYSAQMELSPDRQTLTIRGYFGIPLLGRSEVWHRVRDQQVASSKLTSGASPNSSNFNLCILPTKPGASRLRCSL